MKFSEYVEETRAVAVYPDARGKSLTSLTYVTLGLTNESGEVAGKLKKVLRDDDGVLSQEKRQAILDECGDVLWYLARVVDELDADLESVAVNNVNKLKDRSARGVIKGSGDNR